MNALHDFVPILSLFLSWEWNPPTHSSYSAMRIWNYRWEKRSERDARKAVLMANMLFEIKEIYKHLFSSFFFFCFFFKCVHVFYNVLIISFPRLDKAQSSEIGVCIACNYPILKMRFFPPYQTRVKHPGPSQCVWKDAWLRINCRNHRLERAWWNPHPQVECSRGGDKSSRRQLAGSQWERCSPEAFNSFSF